jgi:metal-dependent hydrolase (beta-lactamase superfamily II)
MEMREQIQKHLDEIKNIFLSHEYDDHTMGWIVEDHIYAIQDILDLEKEKEDGVH